MATGSDPGFQTIMRPGILTRTMILGVGERHQDSDYTLFRCYAAL